MRDKDSVSQWFCRLKAGDEEAAQLLWDRYFDKLVSLARKRLGTSPRRVADEEDVALSVFRCLCGGATRGQFADVENRDQLWRMLVTMTANKAIDQRRFAMGQKRGAGQVRGDSVFDDPALTGACQGLDEIIGEGPTPDFLALLADEHQRLIELLDDDSLRHVALSKMEGYTNEEMAGQLQITRRSVERKLQRIRLLWSEEINR